MVHADDLAAALHPAAHEQVIVAPSVIRAGVVDAQGAAELALHDDQDIVLQSEQVDIAPERLDERVQRALQGGRDRRLIGVRVVSAAKPFTEELMLQAADALRAMMFMMARYAWS